MFKPGATVFLGMPSNNKAGRVLHQASVVDFSSGGFTIALNEGGLSIEAGGNALLFFERRQAFMQQPVRIDAVFTEDQSDGNGTSCVDDGPWSNVNNTQNRGHASRTAGQTQTAARMIVGLQPTGEPFSAEERASYRIVTSVTGGVTATLEDKAECAVLDVSATGFSTICSQPFRQGQVVRASLHFEDRSYTGTAIVQSAKQLPGGKTRFGLHCAGEGASNAQLRNGLQKISADIQRQQLRRRSGNP